MRIVLPSLLLLLLFSSCDMGLNPEQEAIVMFPHEVDLDGDGNHDVHFVVDYVGTMDVPMSTMWEMLRFYPSRNNALLVLPEGRSPKTEDTVGHAGDLADFLRSGGKSPYWGTFSNDLTWIDYNLREGTVRAGMGSGPDGEYIGVRIGSGDTARYGWIHLKANAHKLNGTYRIVVLWLGSFIGEPGQPVIVGRKS